MKRQRATLTLLDTEDGSFSAQVNYQPSLKNRFEDSPSVNAMVKLSMIIARGRDTLAAPIQFNAPKKELDKPTGWQRIKNWMKNLSEAVILPRSANTPRNAQPGTKGRAETTRNPPAQFS